MLNDIQQAVIDVLRGCSEPVPLKHIADALEVRTGSLSNKMGSLIKNGYIFVPGKDDGGRCLYRLTKKGSNA